MIRIVRPVAVPARLVNKGAVETEANRHKYDQAAADYDSGNSKFPFDRSVYSHHTVKRSLRTAQFKKCCYCESVCNHVYAGAVEHVRPKKAVSQGKGSAKEYPGYYWLAYTWENLLFVCGECNTAKSCFFPLVDPSQRARNHHGDVVAERPLLVDPSMEDPRRHIRFRLDAPCPLSPKGSTSIKVLKLDTRETLGERRRTHLAILKVLLNSLTIFNRYTGDPDVANQMTEVKKMLKDKIAPGAEYRSMSMDWFENVRYVAEPDGQG